MGKKYVLRMSGINRIANFVSRCRAGKGEWRNLVALTRLLSYARYTQKPPQRIGSGETSRRGAIRMLAGAAACSLSARGAALRPKTGIIGGGMAGVSLAWLLDGEH